MRQRWYKDPASPPAFTLVKKIYSHRSDAEPLRTVAFFPWTLDSLQTLWKGALSNDVFFPQWKDMINDFYDAIAVGSASKLYIFFTRQKRNPIIIKLPLDESTIKPLPTDCVHVAWTLNSNTPIEPLIIFSRLNLLYIYNVRRNGIASYLRGHGGAITSISVHPTTTRLFCTTSRDHSTRIYDLELSPQDAPSNPCWPPAKGASLAGAAHGLHMTEREGSGSGRCIIVLMGGRSGGHQAAVLGAAFHPNLPLIATCGLDRLVKIWFVPPVSNEILTREDKPLFSSGRIHKARVLSVSWVDQDLLLTHSAPALMRTYPDKLESRETYLEPGQLILWRWLSMDRFFPSSEGDSKRQTTLRGCASDYQESCSFKIISALSFPKVATQFIAPVVDLHHSSKHDPVIVFTYPESTTITILNLINMPPRKPPLFPLDAMDIVEKAQRMGLADHPVANAEELPSEISGWEIRIPISTTEPGSECRTLMACGMGIGGETIVGIGVGGSMWVWDVRD